MEMSCHLHTLATLRSGKEPLVPVVQEAKLAPESRGCEQKRHYLCKNLNPSFSAYTQSLY
jgi:hypothetical protein